MKILRSALILVLSAIVLVSCSTANNNLSKGGLPEDNNEGGVRIVAEVLEVGDVMLVNVTESEYVAGVYQLIISQSTEILDSEGNNITPEEIKVGDRIEAIISEQTMMSYPPKAVVFSIKIL